MDTLEFIPRTGDEIEFDGVTLADAFEFLITFALQLLEVGGLGAFLLSSSNGLFEVLEATIDGDLEFFVDGLDLFEVFGLEARQSFVTAVFVDPADEVRCEIDDFFEHLCLELFLRLDACEKVGKPRPSTAEVPDVHGRGGEFNVAHAVTAHLGTRDFNATTLTDDALEADALVLAAVALPVASRSEDLLAEQAILLRTERAVVNRLRLLHFTVGPVTNLVRFGEADFQLIEHVDVEHVVSLLSVALGVRGSSVTLCQAQCDRKSSSSSRAVRLCLAQSDRLIVSGSCLRALLFRARGVHRLRRCRARGVRYRYRVLPQRGRPRRRGRASRFLGRPW